MLCSSTYTPTGKQTVEIELFQDDASQPHGYLDLSPIMRAADEYRSTAAPTSPLVARASRQSPSRKNKGKGRQVQMFPGRRGREELEAETAAIIASVSLHSEVHRKFSPSSDSRCSRRSPRQKTEEITKPGPAQQSR